MKKKTEKKSQKDLTLNAKKLVELYNKYSPNEYLRILSDSVKAGWYLDMPTLKELLTLDNKTLKGILRAYKRIKGTLSRDILDVVYNHPDERIAQLLFVTYIKSGGQLFGDTLFILARRCSQKDFIRVLESCGGEKLKYTIDRHWLPEVCAEAELQQKRNRMDPTDMQLKGNKILRTILVGYTTVVERFETGELEYIIGRCSPDVATAVLRAQIKAGGRMNNELIQTIIEKLPPLSRGEVFFTYVEKYSLEHEGEGVSEKLRYMVPTCRKALSEGKISKEYLFQIIGDIANYMSRSEQ